MLFIVFHYLSVFTIPFNHIQQFSFVKFHGVHGAKVAALSQRTDSSSKWFLGPKIEPIPGVPGVPSIERIPNETVNWAPKDRYDQNPIDADEMFPLVAAPLWLVKIQLLRCPGWNRATWRLAPYRPQRATSCTTAWIRNSFEKYQWPPDRIILPSHTEGPNMTWRHCLHSQWSKVPHSINWRPPILLLKHPLFYNQTWGIYQLISTEAIKSFKKPFEIYHSSPYFAMSNHLQHILPTLGVTKSTPGRWLQEALARPKGLNRRVSTWTPPAWVASCAIIDTRSTNGVMW